MKSWLLILAVLVPFLATAQPCTLTNAAGCDCLDGSNDCDLLPDLQLSRDLLLDPSENPEIAGELGVSVSTPNTGHGPLRVVATDYFVCGTDTILSPGGFPGLCTDGTEPRQLIKQRVYHKHPDGTMSYTERWAGSMTYHISHGHMHVDDWGVYSLRTATADPDPLSWPIVAEGGKLGFCLMDFGSCSYYYGHCRDAADGILTTDAPNYGLGGGGYSCGMTNQGISAGWTDIYHYYLDGMQIAIPPSVCNGTYQLVVQVDPNNYFLEESDDNNVVSVPITLTQQGGFSAFEVLVDEGVTQLCPGQSATLSVPFFAESYVWSNGMTGPSITVSDPGTYTVTVTSATCGSVSSLPITLSSLDVVAPVTQGDSVCSSGSMTLTAVSTGGTIQWYDSVEGGSLLGSGPAFTTPVLTATTSYWSAEQKFIPGEVGQVGPVAHIGASLYSGSTFNGALIVDVQQALTLRSVKVYTDQAGPRVVEWRDASGAVLASKLVEIPVGESRVSLDFSLLPGFDYQLGTQTAQNLLTLGTESPRLQRSNSGVAMPYVLSGKVSIKDTNFGNALYYYFYDWEVAGQDLVCEGPRAEVVAQVKLCTGLSDPLRGASASLWPNPASGESLLSGNFSQDVAVDVVVRDLAGRAVYTQSLGRQNGAWQHSLPTSLWSNGLYLVEIVADGASLRRKLQVSHP
ncbi:MAG: T9SS type A sorting domain-containing protein [Bacteroidetes bacterium]|nr:T9SS type A sorting domain-containing protein [Bacteroidota bacterium]